MRSHYSLRVLIIHFLASRLKLRNAFVLLSYFTVKSVILVKIAVIKNFSKVSLSKKELESLKNLRKNLDIILQKVSKGKVKSVVILDKNVYLEKMKETLKKRAVSKNVHARRKTLQVFD